MPINYLLFDYRHHGLREIQTLTLLARRKLADRHDSALWPLLCAANGPQNTALR